MSVREQRYEPEPCIKMAGRGWLAVILFFAAGAGAHVPHDNVTALAVSPAYGTDQTVFCGIEHSFTYLLKTTDGGITWKPSQVGLPYGVLSSIAVSPDFSQDGVVFAALSVAGGGGVFKSADGGATWSAAGDGLQGSQVLSLAVSPGFSADQTVFAGADGAGVFISTDGGDSWTSLHPAATTLEIGSLGISSSYAVDRTLFAAANSGLLKSTNAGQSWFNPFPAYNDKVNALALSPDYAQDQTLFLGSFGGGILRSDNGGASFSFVNEGLTETFVSDLGVSPDFAVDRTVMASTRNGVFRSTDAGNTWTPQNAGLDEQSMQTGVHYGGFGFSPDFGQDGTVFLAAFEGLHRSEDGAGRWRHLDVYSQRLLRGLDISPEYASDATVYAGSYGGGVYRSQNGGAAWETINTGLAHQFMHPLHVSPDFGRDQTLFVGMQSFLAKSENRGAFWNNREVSASGFEFTRRLAVSPDYGTDRTLFVADDPFGAQPLYKSTDGAASFSPVSATFPGGIWGLALSSGFAADQVVLVGHTAGIDRSEDGGDTWNRVLTGPWVLNFAFSPAFDTDRTLFAGTRHSGIYRSTDGGDSWAVANAGLESIISIESLAISPDFVSDRTVFAGTRARGVYRSTDAGDSWIAVGMAGDHVPALVVSPDFAADQTVFSSGWRGTYRSTDGGATWSLVLNIQNYDDSSEFVFYGGGWPEIGCQLCRGNSLRVAAAPQASTGLRFVGSSITWIGARGPFAGIANVYVDGTLQGQVDLYAPQLSWQQPLFYRGGLGPGEHVIQVEVSGAMNPASSGSVVIFDAFQVGD